MTLGKPLFLPEPPVLGPRVEKIHSKFSKSRLRSSLGLVLRRGLQGPGATAKPHLPPHLPIPAPSLSLNSAGRVARPGLFSAFNQLSCCFPPGGRRGGQREGWARPALRNTLLYPCGGQGRWALVCGDTAFSEGAVWWEDPLRRGISLAVEVDTEAGPLPPDSA